MSLRLSGSPAHQEDTILPGSRVTSLEDCSLGGYQPSSSVSPAHTGAAGQQGDRDKATAHLEPLYAGPSKAEECRLSPGRPHPPKQTPTWNTPTPPSKVEECKLSP